MSEFHLPYLERIPRETSIATPPLLFLLHGRAAEAKTIFSIEGLLDPRFHIIAIQACYPSEKGGFEWFKPDETRPSEEIADADRFEEAERLLTDDIFAHLARVRAAPGSSNGSLFLWGFSQGAAMSLILGLRGRVQPTGVVPMAGFLPSPIKRWEHWDAHAQYLIIHGTSDEVLTPESSLKAKAFLDSKGVTTEYHEYRGRHKMTLDSIRLVNQWILTRSGLE